MPLPDRLATRVAALIGADAAQSARFGIAVSGGPDSLALLLLAAKAFPDRVAAATVDHQLRPESRDEAEMVARLCAAHAIPHSILTPAQPITGSVQAEARAARYALLDDWRQAHGIDWLMTAHHADDQLETLVMRLNRSSGVGGLAGVRARQGHILRPLLDTRRSELAAWLATQGIEAIDDPSNHADRYDRVRVRKALAGQNLIDPIAAAASATRLADAEAALVWMTAQLLPSHVTISGDSAEVTLDGLPAEIQRRLVIETLKALDNHHIAPRGEALTRTLDAWAAGHKAMLGDWLFSPVPRAPQRLHIRPAPPRRSLR